MEVEASTRPVLHRTCLRITTDSEISAADGDPDESKNFNHPSLLDDPGFRVVPPGS